MPYVLKKENGELKEYRAALEPYICCLAQSIQRVAQFFHKEAPGQIPVYLYVCEKLALQVQPQKRYTLLSAVRAVFSDASYEWCRKMKVKPEKVEFVIYDYWYLSYEIKNLAQEIKKITDTSKEPHLMWPGLLNYSLTILGLKIMDDPKDKTCSALIAGTLKYLHDYFYKRYMAPYEDEQEQKNGGVYPD